MRKKFEDIKVGEYFTSFDSVVFLRTQGSSNWLNTKNFTTGTWFSPCGIYDTCDENGVSKVDMLLFEDIPKGACFRLRGSKEVCRKTNNSTEFKYAILFNDGEKDIIPIVVQIDLKAEVTIALDW